MSRQLQIFNVVLAITAFTLAVACPPTCIKPVYTKDNQDVFEFYEQFSEEQITNFFQRKNMNEVLQSYKSYKSSNCEQIKQAYITSIYQYYSKQKCVDKDVQEMNEYVQNQSGDSKSQNEDYMEVKTKEGQDIFEFFEQFSEEQVTIFFTQKGMQEVLQLYKPYKISKCQQAKLEYIKCLYKYYSKTKCVDQDVQEFNKFIKNNNENSESQTQDSAQNETNVSDQSDNTNSNQDISDVRTKDGQIIFEFYEQFSKEQIISFFEQKGMNEVVQAYKSYKSSESQQDKLTYSRCLSRYYSKHKYADQHVQEITDYVSNQNGNAKSENGNISEIKTSDGQSIFEFYEQFSKEQIISFFEQKGMNEVIQAYKSYKSSGSQQDKLTYSKCLSFYYSKHKYADQHVQEFNEYINNQKESTKSHTEDGAQIETNVSDQSDNTNSNQDISDVRTKDGQIIFEFYEQFSKEQIISFFEQKGMNEVIQAYKSYKSSGSQQDKLTYSKCLSCYYSKHKYVDQHVQEFNEYINNQIESTKSQTEDSAQNENNVSVQSDNTNSIQDISDIRTKNGKSIFEFYEQFSKEQIISFFEQKGMNEVIQAYKSYKSSGSQQDKLTYSRCLSCYYSKHKYADQHVQEITDYVSNQNGNAKSENGNISEIKTSDGQSIFEFFEQHTEEQVISFFEKKDMSEIVQAYKSYKSSRCQPTRQAYIKSLYQYYSKHGCAQQHIHEMNEYLKNENSNCSSNGQQFFATEEVQLVNSYTKTVSRSI